MSNGKILFVVVIMLLAGILYFFGLAGPVLEFIDWLFAAAASFLSSVVEFIRWVF